MKKVLVVVCVVSVAGLALAQLGRLYAYQAAPKITHGPMSGEVTDSSIVLWARASSTGTLTFEIATSDAFTDSIQASVEAVAEHDFTAEVQISDLAPATSYVYRVAVDETDETPGEVAGEVAGSFQTAPASDEAVALDFLFGSCLGGQGYCRNPETGWEIFNTMAAQEPDFFLLTGDSIYASSTCPVPNNVAGASDPIYDLDGFRSRYKYHLEDEAYASFLAHTPLYVGWDDHEVRDNYSGPELNAQNPQRWNDARQSFFDYWPVATSDIVTDTYRLYRNFSYGSQAEFFVLDTRSYRDPIVNWDPHPRTLAPKTMLGAEQLAWLRQGLSDSPAQWKFIVTSVPLAYPTGFPQPEVEGRDSWANFTDKSGYETELLSLIFYLEGHDIGNVVFLTGDTHWPFAVSYDPDRDGAANFHEFGSSPMSALVLPPAPALDPTLNPTVHYAEGEFAGTLFNFGQISIDEEGALTFRVLDIEGQERYAQVLQPE